MNSWLRNSLIIGGTFALAWIVTIYNWRASARLPTTQEVLTSFLLVPAGLLIAIWGFHKIWRYAATKRAALISSAHASSQADGIVNEELGDTRERHSSINLVASAVRTLHGASAEELYEGILGGKTAFDLDPTLTDGNGFPILSGRIKNLDVLQLQDTLMEWVSTCQKEPIAWSEEELRTLSLGEEVINELAQQAVASSPQEAYLSVPEGKRAKQSFPTLELIALLPKNWEGNKCAHTGAFFAFLAEKLGWPKEHILSKAVAISSLTQPFTSIDLLMSDTFRQKPPRINIVVSCESNIGAAIIEKWRNTGAFSGNKGNSIQIPGEGAAGLLFVDDCLSDSFSTDTTAKFYRVALGRHDSLTDSKTRVDSQLIAELVQNALSANNIPAEKITAIVADTDHHVGRITELLGMLAKDFPELDTNSHLIKVTNGCGTMGAVAGLASIVLAHHEVVNNDGMAVCLSNLDNQERAAVVLGPTLTMELPSAEA